MRGARGVRPGRNERMQSEQPKRPLSAFASTMPVRVIISLCSPARPQQWKPRIRFWIWVAWAHPMLRDPHVRHPSSRLYRAELTSTRVTRLPPAAQQPEERARAARTAVQRAPPTKERENAARATRGGAAREGSRARPPRASTKRRRRSRSAAGIKKKGDEARAGAWHRVARHRTPVLPLKGLGKAVAVVADVRRTPRRSPPDGARWSRTGLDAPANAYPPSPLLPIPPPFHNPGGSGSRPPPLPLPPPPRSYPHRLPPLSFPQHRSISTLQQIRVPFPRPLHPARPGSGWRRRLSRRPGRPSAPCPLPSAASGGASRGRARGC